MMKNFSIKKGLAVFTALLILTAITTSCRSSNAYGCPNKITQVTPSVTVA